MTLAELIDDKLDCECQGGTWKQYSANYASCDPGPMTTGLYWDKEQHRCKSPFDVSRPDPGMIIPVCAPGYVKFKSGRCVKEIPKWIAPVVTGVGFLLLFVMVSR